MSKSPAAPSSRKGPTLLAERQAPPPLSIAISVSGSPSQPSRLSLSQGSCVIGASSAADIVIDDPLVSRNHLRLTLVPEGVEAEDLDSRNGSFYLGQRLHRMVLAPGSQVTVGDAVITVAPDLTELQAQPSEAELVGYRGLLGVSAPSRQLFALLKRLEGSLVSVLITGPSGVGKELIARAIHQGSALVNKPLVVVNCATLGGELVRSELFGHRKGAFTGAIESRAGAFEAADGGTLFLDEVGELPLEVQPMLLRVLESGEVTRLGEHQSRLVKVRVLAATNRDLKGQVRAGAFREDLYYRLAVVSLGLPALSERPQDVELLAAHFARQAGIAELPAEVMKRLCSSEWPGNARELRNAVQAFGALGMLPEVLAPDHDTVAFVLGRLVDTSQPFQQLKQSFTDLFTRVYLERLLQECDGNRSEAARRAGIDRSYFGKMLSRHGVGASE